jgi:cobyrinic acid a,c-diamide synthase
MPDGPFGYAVERGRGIDGRHDGLVFRRTMGSYMHQHSLSRPDWGKRLLAAAEP